MGDISNAPRAARHRLNHDLEDFANHEEQFRMLCFCVQSTL
jgi:hypothetical protein